MTKATTILITFVLTIALSAALFGSSLGTFISSIFGIASQTQVESYDPAVEGMEEPVEDESAPNEEIPEEESDEELVTEDATTEEEAPVEDESTSTEEEAPVEDETDATETEEEETVTSDDTENMDALAEAQEFLDYGPLSRQALYETLCGDYGMGYSESAAEYAVDNVGANWNEMALGSAHILLEGVPDMSDDEIYDTLVGEGMLFTDAEAQYAIDNLGSN